MSTPRTLARQRLVQALYQWQLSELAPLDISEQFLADGLLGKGDRNYFQTLLLAIVDHSDVLQTCLEKHLDRPVEQLDPVAKSVLLLGTYELNFRSDVPFKVAINEAVELAKSFGAEGSHKYINGVLDKVAEDARGNASPHI